MLIEIKTAKGLAYSVNPDYVVSVVPANSEGLFKVTLADGDSFKVSAVEVEKLKVDNSKEFMQWFMQLLSLLLMSKKGEDKQKDDSSLSSLFGVFRPHYNLDPLERQNWRIDDDKEASK